MSPTPTAPPAGGDTRPVLIFGAPRSGTSVLSRLLNAHSRITIPFESHLFNQWLPRLAAYGDLAGADSQRRLIGDIVRYGVVHDWEPRPDPEEVAELVSEATFAGIARAIMEWAARAEGKPRWGEKTPHHTLLHREVLAAWPDAQVVMIERDPRDVALSWQKARFGGNHVLPFARAWVRYAEACDEVRRVLPADRRIELRYEDLVRDPEAELHRIMGFLGEAYEPAQLAFHQSGDEWRTDSRNQSRLKQPVSSDSVERWKTGLSERNVRMIEAVTGPAMAARGYAPQHPDASLSGIADLTARYVEYPVQRVLGLLNNRQGFVYLGRDLLWTATRRIGPQR